MAVVYAYTLRGKSAPETSGYIHWLHSLFNFSKIVMDPGAGGGGWWVYKELKKPDQHWNGTRIRGVIPFVDVQEGTQSDKLPIVHWFKRSGNVGGLSFVSTQHMTSDNGLIYATHLRFQEAWNARQILLPMPKDLREKPPIWLPDQSVAMSTIEKGVTQLTKVQMKTDASGQVLTSKGSAWPMFRAVGRKDIAYSKMYAFCAAMLEIERSADEREDDAGVKFSIL
jgi:hypothetical protein